MSVTQLIRICGSYEIANDSNSEVPDWPVQDQGARWHNSKFAEQRVAYDRARVEFGFLAEPISAKDAATLDIDDLPDDVYVIGSNFYRSI